MLAFTAITILSSCGSQRGEEENGKINIVATTTIVADLMKNVGGSKVNVTALMGPGVDPHLYKASEGDVTRLSRADMVFYNGLHLEGKMVDVLEKLEHGGKEVVAVAKAVNEDKLIGSTEYASSYDPHIWFNINLWQKAAAYTAQELGKAYPEHKAAFEKNAETFNRKLDTLKQFSHSKINQLNPQQRVLVTAHDAFNYFGQQYDFKVVGLQGISTSSEAGVKDVQNLADFIYKRKIGAIFIESSVPERNIKALQEAVKAKGFHTKIGGELYSDALGSPGTGEGTYLGMYRHNINTIVDALMLE
ncbi:MAG: zinc ABC transporter substrate-binding protein [Bacteroidales bacterium]|nr:zinc ABC transporter substrate-binding protein [Bacteroidales bacterium]